MHEKNEIQDVGVEIVSGFMFGMFVYSNWSEINK